MSGPPSSAEPMLPVETGFLAPAAAGRPVSHCFRCGKETPPGVSVCDADNPGRIKAPSATQAHATILAGVVAGFVLFLLLLRLTVEEGGPYAASVAGHVVLGGGAVEVAVTIANAGDEEGIASCRITRDGTPRPDDLAFRTERLAPGTSVTITRTVAAPAGAALDPTRMTVICA